ncbi:hypothetical protein T439DRAFT_384561 [Meredithblackwellia eburnea MCA 4105]
MFGGSSLLHTSAPPKAQFRAVVLCGYGADLYPLIELVSAMDEDDEDDANAAISSGGPSAGTSKGPGQVKALLPVAGKRMVDWVLERVEESGVYDILVLTPTSISSPLAHHLRARRTSTSAGLSATPSNAKVELEEIPDEVARKGTVSVVRWATEKELIKTDFIILPCDLLLSPTSVSSPSLATLIDFHRSSDNLLTTLFYERTAGAVVEAKKEGGIPEVLTIFDEASATLLDVREMDEFEDEEVAVRTSLLARYPSPTLSTTLLPTQIYILSASLLPLLSPLSTHDQKLRHMDSIRDLAGWVSRLAWRNKGRGDVGFGRRGGQEGDGGMGRSSMMRTPRGGFVSSTIGGRGESIPPTGANTPALNHSSRFGFEDELLVGTGSAGDKKKQPKIPTGGCKVLVWKVENGWCGRGNTVGGWVELNRAALKHLPPSSFTSTSTPSGVFISTDSFLHPSVYTNLGEKVGIKRCIIGRNCLVGKGSKLTNCVLMDGVVVGEGVKLDNCVLSNGAQVRDRAILKECLLGRDVVVDEQTEAKGEQLIVE